jgi:hypothetical protein
MSDIGTEHTLKRECPLLGVKQTLRVRDLRSAFDPNRKNIELWFPFVLQALDPIFATRSVLLVDEPLFAFSQLCDGGSHTSSQKMPYGCSAHGT